MTSGDSERDDIDEPFPPAAELAKHRGKVIAFDATGEIREATDDWAQMMRKLGERAQELTIMYVPAGALIG